MFKREKKFRETEIAVEGKLKALKLFKRVIVSTDALKLNIRKSHPSCEIVVLHNALNDEWLKKTEIEYKNKEEFRYIGYFCGSHTHDLDFRMCSNSLIKILKENKSLKLLLVGPLNLPENFPLGQVVRYEKTDYLKMGDLIKRCFVTLAPLEDNIFNNCKSSIKFMEAISYGVPCLSSPNQDMVRQEKNGNIVCYSEEDWYHKLNILVEKPSVYNSKIDTFNKNIEENKVSSKVKIFKDYLKNIKF
jgi:hypothetical protein